MTPEVRLKGGAYDVDGSYEPLLGLLSLYSGRDPQPWRTREVFNGLQRVQGFTEEDVSKSVLSTIKGGFAPIRASGVLAQALVKHLHGITLEIETARFQRYMALTLKDVTEAAERFWNGRPPYNEFMVGPSKAMKGAEIKVLKL
ncbi:MAG: hypothetical protein IJS15_01230 [Victivallales bacterium]|nr:hypothetical protein [Victivallales bacterium]